MSLLDARELGQTAELAGNICIVGAGAAGITLATELAGDSRDVILLESGGLRPDEETQALYELESVGYPIRPDFMSRARYFGGSCNLWAGRSMKLSPADTAGRAWVEGSAWPITHNEIEARYPRAAEILGLPELRMFEPSMFRERLGEAERALYGADDLAPTVSLWAPRPRRFGKAYRKRLSRADQVRAVLHANATRIELHPDGRSVTALEAATLDGRRFRVRANAFVLACGGIENARLLLASNDLQANGVGNAHDIVGRYFMDHPRAIHGRVRLGSGRALSWLGGRPLAGGRAQLGIGLDEETRRREGLLNHYVTLEALHSAYTAHAYESFIQTMKVMLRRGHAGSRRDLGRARRTPIPGLIYLLTPKELLPHRLYRWWVRARDALRRDRGPTERTVVYFCEQPPNPESRVRLRRERDALGVPLLTLDWRLGGEVTRSLLRLQEILGDRFRESGVGELSPGEGDPVYTDASHHMGTTRMSRDPKTGVVNPDCRVHAIANLYVAGSSVFPSAGHANPTLTIVALTLRLADHLKNRIAGPAGS